METVDTRKEITHSFLLTLARAVPNSVSALRGELPVLLFLGGRQKKLMHLLLSS